MLFQYYKCEQKKFLYQKWNIIVLIGIAILVPVMVLNLDSFLPGRSALITKSKLIRGFYLGQAGYVVLAALYFGNEYQKSALRTSLLSTPKRGLFLSSKLLCILTWSSILLLITTVTSIAAINCTSLGNITVNEALKVLLPAYLSTFELVIITSMAVILTRSMIVSMAIMVSLILELGNILMQYGAKMKYLPVLSTMNAFFVTDLPGYLKIHEGLTVQALWCVFLLIAAFHIFNKRYVR